MGFPRQEYWSGLPCEVGAIPHPPRKELSQMENITKLADAYMCDGGTLEVTCGKHLSAVLPAWNYSHHPTVTVGLGRVFKHLKNICLFFILAHVCFLCVFLLNGLANGINHFIKLFHQSNVIIRKFIFYITATLCQHDLWESIIFISVCY